MSSLELSKAKRCSKGKVKSGEFYSELMQWFLQLDFDLQGVIQILCHCCLDDMDHEVKTQETLYVKFGLQQTRRAIMWLLFLKVTGN